VFPGPRPLAPGAPASFFRGWKTFPPPAGDPGLVHLLPRSKPKTPTRGAGAPPPLRPWGRPGVGGAPPAGRPDAPGGRWGLKVPMPVVPFGKKPVSRWAKRPPRCEGGPPLGAPPENMDSPYCFAPIPQASFPTTVV